MISNCAYPLVRSMLAEVYNGTIFSNRRDHVPLAGDNITFEWVGTTEIHPAAESDLAAAEILLGQQPDMVAGFAAEEDDSKLPAELLLVANAFCESLGLA